jgi:PIN domain nuclease of toxin-antitoxin system
MIVLDTHIWVWWVHGEPHLPQSHQIYLETHEGEGLGVSIISCWEVAKLVECARLTLPCAIAEWLDQALAYPGVCDCLISRRALWWNQRSCQARFIVIPPINCLSQPHGCTTAR